MKLIASGFLILSLLTAGVAPGAKAEERSESRITREAHPGYTDSVTDERYEKIEEMVLVPRPFSDEINLKQVIFDDRLTQEFQSRWADQFGRTDAERNLFAPSRFDELQYDTGLRVTLEEDRKNRQRFAEYMMRRLVENHVDIYFKSTPSGRKIYELKERISKLNVEVKKGYKVRINYSYSGNYVDLRLENPYDIDSRLRLQMSDGVGPSGLTEAILSLSYPVNQKVNVSSYFYSELGKISLVTSRALGPGLSASITGTTNYRYEKDTEEGQELVLLGLSWNQ